MPISKLFLRIVMLSIVLFVSLHLTIAQTKNDRKLHGVNGLVRKVELGWLEKSKSEVKRKIESIKIYNLEGMEVEEISYANSPGQDREPFLRIVTSVQGLILTQKIYDIHKSSGGLPGGIVGGSPSPPPPQRTKEPDGSTLSQAVIKFDATNNRYEEIWYKRLASSGSIQYKYVYLLNASGVIVEEQVLEGGILLPPNRCIYSTSKILN